MNCLYFIRKSDRSFHSVLSNYSRLISGQIARILTHSHRGLIQCQFLSSHKLGKHLDSSPHLPFLLGLPGLIRTPPFWEIISPGVDFQTQPDFYSRQSIQPDFGQSIQPDFGQSIQPDFGQSIQPDFGQSIQPDFGQSI